jgi:hypothetical protein
MKYKNLFHKSYAHITMCCGLTLGGNIIMALIEFFRPSKCLNTTAFFLPLSLSLPLQFTIQYHLVTNGATCIHEIKSGVAMEKGAFNKDKTLFTSKLDLNLRKKLVNCYIWYIALYGAQTWTHWQYQKYFETFEM